MSGSDLLTKGLLELPTPVSGGSRTMATVYAPCIRCIKFPVNLLSPTDSGGCSIECQYVTREHKEHRGGRWCAGEKDADSGDHILMVPLIYMEHIKAELRAASPRERKRLMVGVYAWVAWYRNGKRPNPVMLAGPSTWWTKVTTVGTTLGVPREPPPNLAPHIESFQKLARKSRPPDGASVKELFDLIIGQLCLRLWVASEIKRVEEKVDNNKASADDRFKKLERSLRRPLAPVVNGSAAVALEQQQPSHEGDDNEPPDASCNEPDNGPPVASPHMLRRLLVEAEEALMHQPQGDSAAESTAESAAESAAESTADVAAKENGGGLSGGHIVAMLLIALAMALASALAYSMSYGGAVIGYAPILSTSDPCAKPP